MTATIAAISASATAITAAATVSPSTTTAAGRPRFAWTCFIYGQRTAFDRFAIQCVNRVLGILLGAHGDKGKAPGFACEFILHQGDFLDGTSLGEEFLEFVFSRAEWQISDV